MSAITYPFINADILYLLGFRVNWRIKDNCRSDLHFLPILVETNVGIFNKK